MIQKYLWMTAITIILSVVGTHVTSAQLVYSNQFMNGTTYLPGTPQFDEWLSFRASLPTTGVTSITVSGSRDPVGRTCSDPVIAQQIADAMRMGAEELDNGVETLIVMCDGFNWVTGACSMVEASANNLELSVGANAQVCRCVDNNYRVRPGIRNTSWGGIALSNDENCFPGPVSTSLIVTVELESPEVSIILSPITATNIVGTEHTVTATVLSDGTPKAGVLVDFEIISGPNAGEISVPNSGECIQNDNCTTDANGQVSWTYTGDFSLGMDTVIASALDVQSHMTIESNTVEKIWVLPPSNVPTLSEWGLIAMAGLLGIVSFMVIRRRHVAA